MHCGKSCLLPAALLLLPFLGGCQSTSPKMLSQVPEELGERDWHQIVRARLPLYGQRNWIVIADAAYPASSRDGIETIVTGADQVEVVRGVLQALDANKHVRPVVYTNAELKFVPEQDAPGITAYRERLADIFNGRTVGAQPHEQLIAKIDQVGTNFRVLVLKTDMRLPYAAIFIQLDSAYWTAEAEKRLRDAQK